MRICRVCNKDISDLYHSSKVCGEKCRKIFGKQYRKRYHKKYYKLNKKRIDEKNKKYNLGYKERLNELARKRYLENHEKELERAQKFREKYPERCRKRVKKYKESKKGKELRKEYLKEEHVKASYRRYQKENPDKVKKWQKKYVRSEKGRLRKLRRRALENGSENKLTLKNIQEIKEKYKSCVYCGTQNNLSFDHVIPLFNGGKNIKENIVQACMSCNKSKREHELKEWCQTKKIDYNEVLEKIKNGSQNKTSTAIVV